jgi:hypothetical protein
MMKEVRTGMMQKWMSTFQLNSNREEENNELLTMDCKKSGRDIGTSAFFGECIAQITKRFK